MQIMKKHILLKEQMENYMNQSDTGGPASGREQNKRGNEEKNNLFQQTPFDEITVLIHTPKHSQKYMHTYKGRSARRFKGNFEKMTKLAS